MTEQEHIDAIVKAIHESGLGRSQILKMVGRLVSNDDQHWSDIHRPISEEDERLLIELLVEQQALKIQSKELGLPAIMLKLGVTQHQFYAVKNRHIVTITERAKELARRRRSGYSDR